MTVVESREERRDEDVRPDDIDVTIVDTDVHPLPVSADVLKSYAPAQYKDTVWPVGHAVTPTSHFYDTP
ncbi:MAG: amidohydrolase, partial [Mycobacteriaceae bacterium]|nr:amidohydrolase [Mycobacteriaceae bacterium]